MNMKVSEHRKVSVFVLVSIVLFSFIVQSCTTSTPVSDNAEVISTVPPHTPAGQSRTDSEATKVSDHQLLEKAFQKQKLAVENIGKQIEKSADLREKAQARISGLKNGGKEVPVLENMLKKYDEKLADIKTGYQDLQQLVKLHKGFDETGKVLDAKEGWQTVKALTSEIRKIQMEFQTVRRIITLQILRNKQIEKTPMPS
jgi:hypothetical protein